MINVSVLSHKIKEGKPDAVKKRALKAGKLDPTRAATSSLYLTLVVEVFADGDWKDKVRLFNLVISDCKLKDGVLKPPARPGGFQRVFFPQVYVLNGIKDNEFLQAVYRIAGKLADEYQLALAPIDECLADWLPDKKVFKNFSNFSLDENDVIWKN